MRIVRVTYHGRTLYAELSQEELRPLEKGSDLPSRLDPQQVRFEPVVSPSKVVCVGLNYHAHAQELGTEVPQEPLLFLKPPSAVIGSGDKIRLPSQSEEVHYEGELAVVLGRHCRNAAADSAWEFILGYTCANDVTARDLQKKDIQYTRAKGFDTFCPLGPWIETELGPEQDLEITVLVNHDLRQQGRTSDMVFSPQYLVSFVSGVMTLYPGDVILTGTPPGVGALHPGDNARVLIEDLGELNNPVESGKGD